MQREEVMKRNKYKTGVINDPLGQPTVPAGRDCRLILKFRDGRTDWRTLCVKIVITTGRRDCGRPRGSKFKTELGAKKAVQTNQDAKSNLKTDN